MTWLLDVNVMIALLDDDHIFARPARDWLARHAGDGWATCPIVENGAARILGHRRYGLTIDGPAAILPMIAALTARPGHVFWNDDVRLIDLPEYEVTQMRHSDNLTDTYLLCLARAHQSCLATFDRRVDTSALIDGARYLQIIG